VKIEQRSPPVLSLTTYRRAHTEQLQYQADRHAYNDGTFVGFCLGIAAAGLAWLILSGVLMEILVMLVRATLTVVGSR